MREAVNAAVAFAIVCLITAGSAWAQTTPVASFEELASVLRIGDKLYVTDTSAQEYEGTVSELSASSIRLVIPGTIREFAASEVSAVARLQPDSKKNGAFIGLGVGAALGAVMGAYAGELSNTSAAGSAALAGLAYGGLGALIGVGIDALSPGKKVLLYSARPPRSAARLTLSPIIHPTRQAMIARISF
jgi:hypothetical protein